MINKVAVIGAGTMGHGIAQVFAHEGYSVSLYDVDEGALNSALQRIRSNFMLFIEHGLEEESIIEEVISHITLKTKLDDAVEEAEFVIEAAPENLELKTEIFKRTDEATSDSVIMASNTSTLSITEIGKRIKKRDRLLVTHWFNPPYLIPVVEIVKGAYTSEEALSLTLKLLRDIGKEPVVVRKEVPGHLVNRIQTAMFREIIGLLEQGVASPEDVDKAVKGTFGLRLAAVGPLTTVDLAGVDLWYAGAKNLYPLLDSSHEPQKLLRTMVEKGFHGIKTNKGFFEYSDDQKAQIIRERDATLLELVHILYERKKRRS